MDETKCTLCLAPYLTDEVNMVCKTCEEDSEYFKTFSNCDNCWLGENQEVQCPKKYSLSTEIQELKSDAIELDLIISPSLVEVLQEEEIKTIDFKNIFSLSDPITSQNIEVTEGKLKSSNAASTTISMSISLDEKMTEMDLSLKTDQDFLIIFESNPKTTPDKKFIYLTKNEIKIKVIPAEERVEPEGAAKLAAGATSIDDSIISSLVAVDPTGTTVKASQMLNVVNKFLFLDIKYGKEMKPYLEACAKIEKGQRIRDDDERISNGYKQKFSQYGIALRFEGDLRLNTIIYLCSWILKIVEVVVMRIIKKKNKIPKSRVCRFLFSALRKIKFTIFCSYSPKIVFFGTRTLLHMKLTRDTAIDKLIVVVVFMLMFYDFVYLFDNIRLIMMYGIENEEKPEKNKEKEDVQDISESRLDIMRGKQDNGNVSELVNLI